MPLEADETIDAGLRGLHTVTPLTEKELEVVDVFLHHETGYLAVSQEIEKQSWRHLSEDGIHEGCEGLVNKGILAAERGASAGASIVKYGLVTTLECLQCLIPAYMGGLSRTLGSEWPTIAALSYQFGFLKSQLTADLVRNVLANRGVEIRYSVEQATLHPFVQARDLDVLPREPHEFRELIGLCFPISRPGIPVGDLAKGIKPFVGDALNLTNAERVAESHYPDIENRLVVFPILALLEVSPSALAIFFGEWEPYETQSMGSDDMGIGMIEHLLFRMVFAAISDLAIIRDIPYGWDVSFAAVRPDFNQAQRHDAALLQLTWRRNEIIGYEAGFDTEHLYVGGEDSDGGDVCEAMRNPENCWVRVWWDTYPPPFESDNRIEQILDYAFEHKELREWALISASALEATDETKRFVARAAWLGDAIWYSITTAALCQTQKEAEVGRLHDLREETKTNAALSNLAENFGIPALIKMSDEVRRSEHGKGYYRIVATHFEALIGAVFMDGGLRAAERVARRLLSMALRDSPIVNSVENDSSANMRKNKELN